MQCSLPSCDVLLKKTQKRYCCTRHHLDHQKLLRMNTPQATKGNPKYSLIDSDLRDRYAAIDEKIMQELDEE